MGQGTVTSTDLQRITLSGVAHRCIQETEQFFLRQAHDPRYCFELFRRAIVERQQHAWDIVYAQYQSQVGKWVERHPAFPISGEETQYFVNRAFEKMWASLTPEKFDHFPDLKSILRYVQMCVHSVIVDFMRLKERETLSIDDRDDIVGDKTTQSTTEERVFAHMRHKELWRCLEERLNDEKERYVVYGSFVLALKPGELYAQSQEMFRDVREVYRVKENVIARLRRDSELKKFLNDV